MSIRLTTIQTDDSIIISSRHQSAVIKIGRDKKVKWILSSPERLEREGWADKVLTPVDKDGKPIKCANLSVFKPRIREFHHSPILEKYFCKIITLA